MEKVDFRKYAPVVMEKLAGRGAFLNARHGDEMNTMTIGWGLIGVVWSKPIFTVAVRYSRHTYKLIDSSGEFVVSVPLDDSLNKALAFCGSRSGRDVDKFAECGLTPVGGMVAKAPLIAECGLHYECRVVYRQAMEPVSVSQDSGIKEKFYRNNDYHVLYYGEIVNCCAK